jgi:D-beta-D-heptose 7-phosphate kinase/D-beta-D-heptose 1-phosphate adenosyltransferase
VKKRRALSILGEFSSRRILIVGDVMLDEYIWGRASRISPEAPVPVVEVERESLRLGGAGNVVSNLVSLGALPFAVGVIGRDEASDRLLAEMESLGVDSSGLVRDRSRRTTMKTRIIAQHQQVVRADRETRLPVSEETAQEVLAALWQRLGDDADGLIVSDYDKGTITPFILKHALQAARETRRPVFLDPKVRNFRHYTPVTLLKPNQREAEQVTGIEIADDESLVAAGRKIIEMVGCEHLLVTRGEHGMALFSVDGGISQIPTVAHEVYDVTGAGDTVMAMLSLAMTSGGTPLEAAVLANYAASIVVAKVGTATASREEVLTAIEADELLHPAPHD